MCCFFLHFDWSKVWDGYQIWYAVFGAIMGSVIAIVITRRSDRRQIRNRKILARNALIERLNFNNDRVVQMLGYFDTGGWPNFLLDTTGIIVWLTLAEDIIPQPLFVQVNWHRYQLDHVNAKLAVYYGALYAPPSDDHDHEEMVKGLRQSIYDHLADIRDGVAPLITALQNPKKSPNNSK